MLTLPKPDSLLAIEEKLGRPLRVLHLGNIANNAYNNAKIQRQYGIKADVMCYDYYHIMACPEWEDASFSGEVDHNFPDWWSTSLGGWQRPHWFVQGPASVCILYLLAKMLGLSELSAFLWQILEAKSFDRLQHEQRQNKKNPSAVSKRMKKLLVDAGVFDCSGLPEALCPDVDYLKLLDGVFDQVPATRARPRLFKTYFNIKELILFRLKKVLLKKQIEEIKTNFDEELDSLVAYLSEHSNAQDLTTVRHKITTILESPVDRKISTTLLYDTLHFIYHRLVGLTALFSLYDIVQGYSTDGLFPFICGKKYTAYEHGTLRDLPFHRDYYGVVTNAVYKNADHVFITNSDVLEFAKKMGLQRSKICCLPHAFDDSKLLNWKVNQHIGKPSLDKVITVFSPARHDWVQHDKSLSKGNDTLFRAVAKLAKSGIRIRMRLVEWGRDLEASRNLLSEIGLAGSVEWLPTMKKQALWREYIDAHVVADQFVIPALGGIGFEVMTLSRRLITALDIEQTTDFFGQAPPCLIAQDVEECAARLLEVVADPLDKRGIGERSGKWVREYHSAQRIVALQSNSYEMLLKQEAY